MKALELTQPYKLQDLERLCEQTTNQRTRQRLQAIYLRAQGKTIQEIALLLNVAPKTIRYWIKLFNAGGHQELEYKHTGGRQSKLSPEQETRLRLYLKEPSPDGRRWTLKALANKLFEDYGIRLSQQQVSQRIRGIELNSLPSKKTKSYKTSKAPGQQKDEKESTD